MAELFQSGSMRIATLMGIPIRVHYSWLIIFGLITWSLSTFYFPQAAPQLPGLSYFISGALAALLLFISVGLHELSHSFIAKRQGQTVSAITLFIFGGVSQMKAEPSRPKDELFMAVAGPVSSFLLSLIFFIAYNLVTDQIAGALFRYLSHVNLFLGIFNLIPGFPMDGGRVVRAYIWGKTGDFFSATRKASNYGQRIALFFILFGIFSIFTGVPGGLWLVFIGWFLHSAAQASYQQAGLQETLSGVKVKDIMVTDIVTVPPDITINEAIHKYFLKYGYGGFPVVDKGDFLGILTLKEITDIPEEERANITVSKVFVRHDKRWEVSKKEDAITALERMISEDKGRLAVLENRKLIGLITRTGIARYMQMRGEMQK